MSKLRSKLNLSSTLENKEGGEKMLEELQARIVEEIQARIVEELKRSEDFQDFPGIRFFGGRISDIIDAIEGLDYTLPKDIEVDIDDCLGEFGNVSGYASSLEELEELNITKDVPDEIDAVGSTLSVWTDPEELASNLLTMHKNAWKVNLKFTEEHLLFRSEIDGQILRFGIDAVLEWISENSEEVSSEEIDIIERQLVA